MHERAQQEHWENNREDEHLLQGACLERGVGFEKSDADRADDREGVAHEPTDDGRDEALQANEKAGVVVDRRQRGHENA
jgi:hypothetical protein